MRKTNLRKSKGITLIALVITIIVLLILAGVAISMLSGENGILRKAAEAKTKTEEGQNQESTALATMDLETYFLTSNSQYKCSNGFITGIKVGTKVSEFQSALPDGYTVKAEDETDNFTAKNPTDGQPIVATGLAIQKDNKTVARTVIFGDVYCDGIINSADASRIAGYLIRTKCDVEDYKKVAMDINHDGYISAHTFEYNEDGKEKTIDSDPDLIYATFTGGKDVTQQHYYTRNPNDIKMFSYQLIIEEFLDGLSDDFKKSQYSFVSEGDSYVLKGVTSSTTAKELIDLMPTITIKQKKAVTVTGDEALEKGIYRIFIPTGKYGYTDSIKIAGFTVE